MARAALRDHRGKKAGGQGKAAAARAVVAAPAPARPPPAPLPPPPPPTPTVAVTFSISHRVAYGQSVAVVGSASALGGWSLASVVPLSWSDGDVWRATVPLPAGALVEYKYVVIDGATGGADAWQRGNNSVLAVGDPSAPSSSSSQTLELYDNWEGAPGAAVVAPDGVAGTREGRLAEWASSVSSSLATARADLRSARLELAAATSDAAAARAEAEEVKAALAEAEAGRVAAVAVAEELRSHNAALAAQLADNTAAFKAAMAEVSRLLEADD